MDRMRSEWLEILKKRETAFRNKEGISLKKKNKEKNCKDAKAQSAAKQKGARASVKKGEKKKTVTKTSSKKAI